MYSNNWISEIIDEFLIFSDDMQVIFNIITISSHIKMKLKNDKANLWSS
jgi:hypothetical protein